MTPNARVQKERIYLPNNTHLFDQTMRTYVTFSVIRDLDSPLAVSSSACRPNRVTFVATRNRQGLRLVSFTDNTTLPCEHFRGKFSYIFAGHCPLQRFEQRVSNAEIVSKRLCAVHNVYSRSPAKELIACAFVGVLKSSPSTDVIYQHGSKLGFSPDDVVEQRPQTWTSC